MDLMSWFFTISPLVASSSDEGGEAAALPLLLLLSGFIFYGYIYSKYRNADKRHSHESETKANIANLGVLDSFIEHRKGLKNAKLKGANQDRIEGALNKKGAKASTSANAFDLAKKLTSGS